MRAGLEKINQWLQIAVLVTLPIEPKSFNNVAILLWCLSTVLTFNTSRFKVYRISILPFAAYFTILMAGLLAGPDPFSRDARMFVEARLGFLLLPLFLLGSQPVDLNRALKGLVIIGAGLCLKCLFGAILKNLEYNEFHGLDTLWVNPWFFTYFLYSDHVGLHPTYFAMYLMLCIVFLLGWQREEPLQWFDWATVIFLSLNLIALMSRMMIALMAIYFCSYVMLGLKARLQTKFVVGFVGVVVLAAVMLNPVAQQRVRDTFESENALFSGANLKIRMWNALYSDVVLNHMWLGVGPVNRDELIREVYRAHGIMEAYEENFNAHNQYLEAWVHHGVIGLAALLVMYGFYIVNGIRQRNHIIIVAMLIVIFVSVTESMLMRQKGILFLSFLIPFVYLNSMKRERLGHRLAAD